MYLINNIAIVINYYVIAIYIKTSFFALSYFCVLSQKHKTKLLENKLEKIDPLILLFVEHYQI